MRISFARILSVGLVLGATAACTLLNARTELYCSTDEGCRAKLGGPARCASDGTCQQIFAPDASNVTVGCSTALDCQLAQGGAAAKCVSGRCAPVLNAEVGCGAAIGNVIEDNTVVIGTFGATTTAAPPSAGLARYAPLASDSSMWPNLIATWNLTKVPATGRPYAIVICDESKNPSGAIDHLSALGASAVMGPFGPESIRVAAARAAEKQLAYVSPLDERSKLETNVLAAGGARADMANAAFDGYQAIAAKVRADRNKTALKVVIVSSDSGADREFHDRFFPKLQAAANTTSKAIDVTISYTEGYTLGGIDGRKISAEAPDIVIMNANWVGNALTTYAEASWDAFAGGAPRPNYIYIRQGDAGVEVQAARGPNEVPMLGRSFLIDWDHDAVADKARGVADRLLKAASREIIKGSGLTSELGHQLIDSLYLTMIGTQAVISAKGVAPQLLKRDSFLVGVDLLGTANGSPLSIYPDDLADAISLFSGGRGIVGSDTTGAVGFGSNGTRSNLKKVGVSCLSMKAAPRGWRTAKTYAIEGGSSIDPIVCPPDP